MKDKPNPGSDEAIKMGCTCPVLDNAHGGGDSVFGYTDNDGNPCFWINAKCPIHGTTDEISVKEH